MTKGELMRALMESPAPDDSEVLVDVADVDEMDLADSSCLAVTAAQTEADHSDGSLFVRVYAAHGE